jgi:mannose-6-phosphate isomerase-like protein (cupin superfamily)
LDALQLLTGDAQNFLDKIWASQVHIHQTDPKDLVALLSVDEVDRLLLSTALRAPALRIAQNGDVLPTASFTRPATLAGQPLTGLVDGRKVLALFDDGASVVLQGLHRYWPPLTALVRELELALGHPCQANAYLTPPGSQGFAVHSDTHDVFVFQTYGTKQWEVHDGGTARAVVLEPGLSMYLPCGTPHAARAQEIASLHVTIGINQLTWRGLLQRITGDLLKDEKYEGRVPAGYLDDPATLTEQLEELLQRLGADVAAAEPGALANEASVRFLSDRSSLLRGSLTDLMRLDALTDDTQLVHRHTTPCVLVAAGERLRVLLGDRELLMPGRLTEPMSLVRDRKVLCPADLAGSLDPESRLVLCRRLVREGLLRISD